MSPRRLAVGVGVRSGADASAIAAGIGDALSAADGIADGLFTLDRRATEPGLVAAALALDLPLTGLPQAALAAVADRALTRSAASLAATGLPSVAETAALAGGGPGSRLLAPRRAGPGFTVAIASRDAGR